MALTRFGISLNEKLLRQFDAKVKADGCPTRSKAIADLIRNSLVQDEWKKGKEVAGAIVLVYDHHVNGIATKLIDVQHDHHKVILSTQHIHLDHDNCLEIIAVRGKTQDVDILLKGLKALKGLKHISLGVGTTGRQLS